MIKTRQEIENEAYAFANIHIKKDSPFYIFRKTIYVNEGIFTFTTFFIFGIPAYKSIKIFTEKI